MRGAGYSDSEILWLSTYADECRCVPNFPPETLWQAEKIMRVDHKQRVQRMELTL